MSNYMNENEEYEIWEQPRQKSRIGLGILIGALSAVFVTGLAIGIGCMVTGTQIVITNRGSKGGVFVESGNPILTEDAVAKLNELSAYSEIYYYNDMDVEKIQDEMYKGMIDGLDDKYSVYYNKEEYVDLQLSTTGQYCGIGAGLTQDLDTMVISISKIYAGTPSEEAGLKQDDIILSVDGTDAANMKVDDLVKLIRGEEGTKVNLEIYRPASDEYLSFDVERKDITLPSVSYEMMENNIGYILIESFETDTAHQFETAIKELENAGMKGLILDVRYNPGGMLLSVVEILDMILPEGTLVYTEDKAGKRETYSSDDATKLDLPIAVLINEDSASAAEILAGAIKDYDYGTLIGTTTFGKGIVQMIFPLSDGDAVKLTTAKYFTPAGNYIHDVGIAPDIELEYEYLNPDGTSYEKQYDNQILRAIEVLLGKITK